MITSLFIAAVTILLPAESGVRGTEIELGEIASISGADAATQNALEQLRLDKSPMPGFRRVFDRGDIQRQIRKSMPDVELTFAGRAAVGVYTELITVEGDTIIAAVEDKIAKLKGKRDITWKPINTIGDIEVPMAAVGSGEPQLEIELQKSELETGNLGVSVHIKVEGLAYRTIWADWKVSVWEQLPVLMRNVPAGSPVTPELFTLRRTELPSEGIGAVLSPSAMVGAVATHSLLAGALVVEGDVTRPTILHTGDQVNLVVKKGSIRAQVAVILLESAGVGDTVRVKRVGSDTELRVKVISSDLLQLDLGA